MQCPYCIILILEILYGSMQCLWGCGYGRYWKKKSWIWVGKYGGVIILFLILFPFYPITVQCHMAGRCFQGPCCTKHLDWLLFMGKVVTLLIPLAWPFQFPNRAQKIFPSRGPCVTSNSFFFKHGSWSESLKQGNLMHYLHSIDKIAID